MRSFKTLGVLALALPLLAEAHDLTDLCDYDYGFPPPLPSMGLLGDLVVGAEWLYMKPAVDDLYFAERAHLPLTTGDVGTYNRISPRFKWDSGVRVNVGYALPFDQWELNASWTYFRTTASNSTSTVNNFSINDTVDYIVPILFDQMTGSFLGTYTASGNWDWRFNQLDIDFSRVSFLNPSVSFRPVAGFRFLWSQQHLDTLFAFVPASSFITSIDNDIRTKNDYKAFGLKLGFDTTWNVGICGIILYGSFDWSILIGDARLSQTIGLSQVEAGSPSSIVAVLDNNPKSLKQMFRGAFGLAWETTFNCDQMALIVKAGWEQFYIPNFSLLVGHRASFFGIDPETINTVPYSIRGDMGLYGLVLGADLVF